LFTYKAANAVIKLVLNSGKSSPTSTASTQLVPTTEILIYNSKESMYTSMKPLVDVMFPELFLWISNQELWTPSVLDHSVNSSDPTTSSSAKPEPETTGPRDTTLRVLN
jgi:hypothetical protein